MWSVLLATAIATSTGTGDAWAAVGDRNGTIKPGYTQDDCLTNDSGTSKVSVEPCKGVQSQAWLVSATGSADATVKLGYAQGNCLAADTSGLVHIESCAHTRSQDWLISGTDLQNGTIRPGYAQSKCLTFDSGPRLVYVTPCVGLQKQAWLVS